MPAQHLQKISSKAQLNIFSRGTVLFRKNEPIDYLYMVLMGQVALEIELSPELNVILSTIHPGYSFGVSSLVSGARAGSTAICQEPCELITLPVDRLAVLFQEDPDLGYQFMLRLARIFQKIMVNRTQMIMKTLDQHPEFQEDLGDLRHLAPVL
ncbi:MAG: cyclic nucleotide-binding domain-containing protein [Desulfohalobiaceae bacterium]|nr:cyclic nucleotide-binding domain-containing protein [Desulfohalobiaceae bacterium]